MDDDEDLNNTDPVDQVLLELEPEDAVTLLSPVLERLEDVEGAFGVASEDLE